MALDKHGGSSSEVGAQGVSSAKTGTADTIIEKYMTDSMNKPEQANTKWLIIGTLT